jgi:hypothetical protein
MSIVSSPEYPVFDEEVTLSLTGAIGTASAFELNSVPSASSLVTKLLLKEQTPGSTIPTSPIIAANEELTIDTFTPDVAGEYAFTGYDLKKVVGVPAFPGDPSADERYEVVGTQNGIVNVGTIMELPVVTSDGHGGTIELRVVLDTVRAAEIVDPVSEIGKTAALQQSVITTLDAVVGLSVDAASTDFLWALRDVCDAYNGNPSALPAPGILGHRERAVGAGGYHLEPDDINALDTGIPFSLKYAVKLVNELRDKLIGHFEGSVQYATLVPPGPPPPPPVATPPQYNTFWHFTAEQEWVLGDPIFWPAGPTGRPGVDATCTPILGPAINLPTAAVLLCELRLRAYDRHLHLGHGNTASHPWLTQGNRSAPHIRPPGNNPADSIQVPASPIDNIIVEYLDSIIRMDPSFSPPAAEGTGIANMAHKYGFKVKGT